MSAEATIASVAVVDDDASFRNALVALIEALDFRVMGFDDATSFLDDPGIDTFDCLVSDIQMPVLTGFDLINALRTRSWKKPVILVTARPEQDLHRKAQASGALALLRKPLEAASFVEWLQKAVTDCNRDERHGSWRERHDRSD